MSAAKELLFEALLLLYVISIVALFWTQSPLLTALFALNWIVGLRLFRAPGDAWLYAVGGIMGAVGEVVVVHVGVWTYAHPNVLGIPAWLPLGWGCVLVLMKRTSETVSRISLAWPVRHPGSAETA